MYVHEALSPTDNGADDVLKAPVQGDTGVIVHAFLTVSVKLCATPLPTPLLAVKVRA